jgi:RNA polymerase sigma-54 factor
MALDLRLQQKMTQQLVMTPQLQQAIKLLQLNHLEMAEVLREEMEQNPLLEEGAGGDTESEAPAEAPSADDGSPELLSAEPAGTNGDGDGMSDGDGVGMATPEPAEARADGEAPSGDGMDAGSSSEIASDLSGGAMEAPADATPEPSSSQVEKEIDWEAYLDSYSYSLPATAGGAPSDELPPFEATMSKPTSLPDHLRWQVQMQEMDEADGQIALMLIEELNDDGYLTPGAMETVAEELEITVDNVERVLKELQRFDPPGVFARDLRECLLLQCGTMAEENPLVIAIIDKHLKSVEKRNYALIAKELKCTVADVAEAVKVIAHLEPRPGRTYSDKEPQYITPDIYVYKVGDDYVIVLNEDGLPKLRISNYYRNALARSGGNTKSYIQEKLRSAAWLIRSIHMRQRTIYRVMESILKFQRDFFDQGVAHLKPLILKDVAEDVGMHESTISRVTTNKYVHTPRGIFELKYFFNSSINRIGMESIASESVRDHIKKLIDEEDQKNPLSDQQIVEILKGRDIDIARRTVAKYRDMLKIPSSSKRKQIF